MSSNRSVSIKLLAAKNVLFIDKHYVIFAVLEKYFTLIGFKFKKN